MARFARVVAPHVPHQVTQRGNRRQRTFFSDADYAAYLGLLQEWSAKAGLPVWTYCLMPNHVHLVVAPETSEALGPGIGEVHRRYSRMVNFRERWRGYLWQGRFASFPMDEPYLLTATRYILLNPVRAGLVTAPEDWPYSSARAHFAGKDNGVVRVAPLAALVHDWPSFLTPAPDESELARLRRHERTGRPLGAPDFVGRLEKVLGRVLAPQKLGPKRSRP
jgi:putative transposase